MRRLSGLVLAFLIGTKRVLAALNLGLLAALALVPLATAQEVTGTLGSPSATTTISGEQLPPPDPQFGGVIKDHALQSTPWWAPGAPRPPGKCSTRCSMATRPPPWRSSIACCWPAKTRSRCWASWPLAFFHGGGSDGRRSRQPAGAMHATPAVTFAIILPTNPLSSCKNERRRRRRQHAGVTVFRFPRVATHRFVEVADALG